MKHTEGTWEVETQELKRPSGCTQYFITAEEGKILIAEFKRINHLKEEAEANARLTVAYLEKIPCVV